MPLALARRKPSGLSAATACVIHYRASTNSGQHPLPTGAMWDTDASSDRRRPLSLPAMSTWLEWKTEFTKSVPPIDRLALALRECTQGSPVS